MGIYVRGRRRGERLSQRELAELAGVGPRVVWELEQGKRTLRMDVVNAVARLRKDSRRCRCAANRGERMMRRGVISLDGQRVGVLEETELGSRFRYDGGWLARKDAPISLTLPLQEEAYESRGLLPFFENLLPEGWLLELSTAKLKICKDDAFGLLLATCADCIGAVEVRPYEVKPHDEGGA